MTSFNLLLNAIAISAILGHSLDYSSGMNNSVSESESKVAPYVVGGQQTQPFQYPFMVFFSDGRISCGGSIVARNLVVTAGHCITARDISRYKVIAHRHDMRQSEQAEKAINFKVKQVIVHPQYNPNDMHNNDIALLVLDNDNAGAIPGVNMDQLIELDTQGPSRGQTVKVIGWGFDNDQGIERPSPVLKEVDLAVTDNSNCQRMFAQEHPSLNRPLDPSTKICAAQKRQRESSCKGDSGGPLVTGNKLVGLVSHGLPQCNGQFTVYTRVANYINWINQYKAKPNGGNNTKPEQPQQPEQPQRPEQPEQPEQPQQPQQPQWPPQQPQQPQWPPQQPQQPQWPPQWNHQQWPPQPNWHQNFWNMLNWQ